MRHKRLAALLLGLLTAGACNRTPAPEPIGPVPTPQQLAWQQMEMNMFMHFGPNTFTNREWGDGREPATVFHPEAMDCGQWAAIARDAGMGGVIITAKHHDGFCLWPNPVSGHTVAQSGWRDGKGDVLRELSDACREYGLKFGVYISPWDRNDPTYGSDAYNEVFRQTLASALGSYGEVFEQWFDGACGEGPNGKVQVYDWDLFHRTVFEYQPQAIIFADGGPGCRWIGNERGIAGETCWSTLDSKTFGKGDSPKRESLNCGDRGGDVWVPGEADVSIRPGWFYRESEDSQVKSLADLLRIYYASVGRNALLLLNVPPDRRGLIHPVDSVRLHEFRAALDRIFADDLAQGAQIEASNVRGESRRYAAANLLDADYDSYWATDDGVCEAAVELRFDAPRTFNRVLLQEYIPLGQRVARFHVEALGDDGTWYEIARQTTIGYKRIVLTDRVTTAGVRIVIDESLACPVLNRAALYLDNETVDEPRAARDKQGRITLTTAEPDAAIYYTLDGSLPTPESAARYTGPIVEKGHCTLRAIAVAGERTSCVSHFAWDIAPTAFRTDPPEAAGAVDGLSDDGSGPETCGAVLAADQALTIDLGGEHPVTGFFCEPLHEGRHGCVVRYDLAYSRDGRTWTTLLENAAFDNIVNNPTRREVRFGQPVRLRHLRLTPRETSLPESYGIGEMGVLTPRKQ